MSDLIEQVINRTYDPIDRYRIVTKNLLKRLDKQVRRCRVVPRESKTREQTKEKRMRKAKVNFSSANDANGEINLIRHGDNIEIVITKTGNQVMKFDLDPTMASEVSYYLSAMLWDK